MQQQLMSALRAESPLLCPVPMHRTASDELGAFFESQTLISVLMCHCCSLSQTL